VHNAHRQGDLVAPRPGREAGPVPPLVGEGERLPDARRQAEPLDQHVGDLAAGREVVDRPVVCPRPERRHDPLVLLGGTAGGRELHHGAHHVGWVAGIEHERVGQDGDVVAEDGGDLVRVACAPQIAQQRDPVDGVAQLGIEAGFLAQRHRQQARPQLRLERLSERVVLPQGERRHELTQTKTRLRNGVTSRCAGPR
jgi:hypothetical protein